MTLRPYRAAAPLAAAGASGGDIWATWMQGGA